MTFKKTAMGVAAGLLMSLSAEAQSAFTIQSDQCGRPYISGVVMTRNGYFAADNRGNYSAEFYSGQVQRRIIVLPVQQPVFVQQPVYPVRVYDNPGYVPGNYPVGIVNPQSVVQQAPSQVNNYNINNTTNNFYGVKPWRRITEEDNTPSFRCRNCVRYRHE